jgi:hypothetical protein
VVVRVRLELLELRLAVAAMVPQLPMEVEEQ